jgi:hypothetical protein
MFRTIDMSSFLEEQYLLLLDAAMLQYISDLMPSSLKPSHVPGKGISTKKCIKEASSLAG